MKAHPIHSTRTLAHGQPTMLHIPPAPPTPFSLDYDPFLITKLPLRSRSIGMAANEQMMTQAGDTAKLRAPQARKRTLQCTHMDMLPQRGTRECQLCGRVPAFGFLYTCRQDVVQAKQYLPEPKDVELSKLCMNGSLQLKVLTAEVLGMSTSIIKQMSNNFYTADQVEELFHQRRHAITTMRDAAAKEEADQQATPGTVVRGESCGLLVCHACKPFLRDRTYADPLSITEEGFQFWDETAQSSLPISDAAIIKAIVLPGEGVRLLPTRPYGSSSPASMSESDYSTSSDDHNPWADSTKSSVTADISKYYDSTEPTVSWGHEQNTSISSFPSTAVTEESVRPGTPDNITSPLKEMRL